MRSAGRRFRLLWLVGLAVLAASVFGAGRLINFSGAGALSASPPAPPPEPSGVVCFGHVDVEQGVGSLYPLLPGRVTEVPVHESEAVKAGTVLVRLDDRLASIVVQEAEADLEAAQEQLRQARKLPEQQEAKVAQQRAAIEAVRQRLAAARHVSTHKRELVKLEQLNAREADAAEAQVKALEAALEAEEGKLRELELNDPTVGLKRARAEVKAKEARLAQARRGLDESLLKAPADGTVLRVLVAAGDVLGSQPKQAAILFCSNGPRIIRAEVEQEFAGRVAAGQVASVQDDSSAGTTWRGKVARISDWYTRRRSVLQEPFQFNDVRTLECIIALDPGQHSFRIGQRVRVTISQ